MSSRAAPVLGLLFLAGVVCAQDQAPERSSGWIAKRPVTSRHAMIVTANPLATAAGRRILRQGGSAVDAAIASQLVLNLVEPQASGIGGGAFLVHYDSKNGSVRSYDGRETAPATATPDRFLDATGKPMDFFDAVVGGRSVGVPGTLRMLELAHRHHGKMPWHRLFVPAIEIATRGFAVSSRMHGALAANRMLPRDPEAAKYFYEADGAARPVGFVLKNPAFAETLKRVAAGGADAFYNGEIAQEIVAKVRSHPTHPGDMTEADLAGYRAKFREPVCGHYRAYRVCGMPLPSSGGMTVLQIVGMLERFDLSQLEPTSLYAVHLLAEAESLAFADRDRYLADPDFVEPPQGLLDAGYLRMRAQAIRLDAALGRAQPGDPGHIAQTRNVAYADDASLELPSTSHLSIVDRHGNAVAMTTSIEYSFGSQMMVRGFMLNNELTDFSFVPADEGKPVANRVESGKRPRSSMAPTIVFDRSGRLHAILGSAFGSHIIKHVARTLVGIIDWRLDPQRAIDLPNIGSRNLGFVELERGTSSVALEPKLRALGHDVRLVEDPSCLGVIVRTKTGWIAGADPRREGIALGD